MGLQFTAKGADTVTVTFVRPNEPDVVIEVQFMFLLKKLMLLELMMLHVFAVILNIFE